MPKADEDQPQPKPARRGPPPCAKVTTMIVIPNARMMIANIRVTAR